jgi:type I site-specific restriction endonuclease
MTKKQIQFLIDTVNSPQIAATPDLWKTGAEVQDILAEELKRLNTPPKLPDA